MTGFRGDRRTATQAEAVHAQAYASAEGQDPMLSLRYYLLILSPLYVAGATCFLSAVAKLGAAAWRSDAVVLTAVSTAGALVMLLAGFAAPITAIRTWRKPPAARTAAQGGARLGA